MDEFLRETYCDVFKYWLLSQDNEEYHVYLFNDYTVHIETKYSLSKIIFYDMSIIEMTIKNTVSNKIEFYLHFQMTTIKHALELYYEMLDCIKGLIDKPVLKVLLSCSGGLTTTYFASEIQKGADVLHYPMQVDATGYNNLYKRGEEYDVILLAPQVSYIYPKVKAILKNQIILKIPSKIFAGYDVAGLLKLIEDALEKRKDQEEEKKVDLKTVIKIKSGILSLSLFRNSNRVHIAYRIYNKDKTIIENNDVIKPSITLSDVYDVVDMVMAKHPGISIIGVSCPGIINDGELSGAHLPGFDDCNLKILLEMRYNKEILVENDVNCAAVGYYYTTEDINSLSFLFKTVAGGDSLIGAGVGTIINGELLNGVNNLAGEVNYIPLSSDHSLSEWNSTPEGALEIVSKLLVTITALNSPELLVLFCVLITDLDEVRNEMSKYIPMEYIPSIVQIDDIIDYTLIGTMVLCSKKMA